MTEGPYKLPEGWRWVRLGEISTKPQYGLSQAASPEPIGPKFVRITDITSGQIEWEDVPYCRVDTRTLEKYWLDKGDLLFARSGSIGATILIKEKPPCDAVFASYLIRIRLDVSVALPEFVDLFVKSSVGQAQLVPQGAAQKNINAKLIQRLLIPLPPLEEQRRIVARIEELMGRVREARRLREEARNDVERLWQAILAQTFPRPGSELPEGWRWAKLGEVCDVERKTLDPRRFPEKEFFVYSIPAYDKNESPELLKGAEIGSAKLVIEPGVCLFSKLNPRIPRAWAIREDPPVPNTTLLASTEFMPLRPHSQLLDLEYLRTLLLSDIFLNQVRTDVTGATGSRQRLRTEIVLDAFIPLPPLEEQRRIVAHLQEVQERIKALKEAQEQTEAELKRLEQAILEKAFRGEL